MTIAPVQKAFDEAMQDVYRRAWQECGYKASYFHRMLNQHGGVGTAKLLLATDDVRYGFRELWEHGRVDLTVEAQVLRKEFRGLFTDKELERARERLLAHGYDPDREDAAPSHKEKQHIIQRASRRRDQIAEEWREKGIHVDVVDLIREGREDL